ncbi:MAG: DUF2780 domain-containing protein, partial [Cyanothece sp. SIO1E1]|nr:DUF2780 domain-containing protein [Cyanothece sp. SIO1E1]
MSLIEQLTSTLGVQENQAQGGAGLIFQMAKDKLGDEDFAQIAQSVPGLGEMLQSAPGSNTAGGGMLGALGGLASAVG